MPKAAPKPLPYPVVRAVVVLLSAFAFFLIVAVLGAALSAALTHDVLRAAHAAWILSVGLLCVAFFAGQGGSIGLLDVYSQGRVTLPAGAARAPAGQARNPWSVALRCSAWLGLPLGALAFGAVYGLWPEGLSRASFCWLFALSSAALGGGIACALTGRPFLEETQRSPAERAFRGSHEAYLWQRHVLPQGLINLFINGWVALAIAPASIADADPRVARELVLADATGTALVLALAIAGGVHSYARFDLRWGVVSGSAGKAPHAALRVAALFGSALLPILLVQALFAVFGWQTIGLASFVIGRSLLCGVYCGLVAFYSARWNQLVPDGVALTSQAGRAAA